MEDIRALRAAAFHGETPDPDIVARVEQAYAVEQLRKRGIAVEPTPVAAETGSEIERPPVDEDEVPSDTGAVIDTEVEPVVEAEPAPKRGGRPKKTA